VTGGADAQRRLKMALLNAYQGRGEVIDSHDVLLNIVQAEGMDVETAMEILRSDTYAEDVRAKEHFYTSAGIHSVPAVIINDKHLISGGQPAEVFTNALRQIAAGA
jgi:predicted DsbA family dithiol-disulfide isomerase